jgi:hypothetical protein
MMGLEYIVQLSLYRRQVAKSKIFGFEALNRFLPAPGTALEVMYSSIRAIQANLDRQTPMALICPKYSPWL